MPMLEVRDIRKAFGELKVLNGVDISVEKGDVVAILGPSGSGKTTLLRCVSFLERADAGTLDFDGVPVDGSSKIDDILMESIEPFDFSEAVDFQTAYLSGFFADKYDVDSEQSIGRANDRIKRTTENAFASTVFGYTTVYPEHSSVVLHHGVAKYALYPVWLLTTKWNGENYTFAMNGQTGKMVGDLPMDKKAYARWFAGVGAMAAAVSFAIGYLIWLL